VTDLITLDEAGRRLGGISRRTVDRLCADGSLRKVKVRGSSFVTAAEVERYLVERTRGRVA
jgi:excisionase family DNA binding protein